jgi:hypothetical protein
MPLDLTKALTKELQISVLRLVINRVLRVLFVEKEHPVLEGLLSQLPENAEIRGLAIAGKRRVLRETVQYRAISRVRDHVDSPCSELPYLNQLERDPDAIDVLIDALQTSE